MAELILTETEKKTKSWLDLDDESLGKLVKAMLFKIKDTCEQEKKIFTLSAAIALCVIAHETNADNMKLTIENITSKGKGIGDWKVTIKRITKKEN